jgi:23S rRNA (guanosine2251-2'-O)-methyltransferase
LQDSQNYIAKKSQFAKVLTIYGRNAVLEALQDKNIKSHKLHLANSNQKAPAIDEMVYICEKNSIEIAYHDKLGLSRISKNAKQDQGVALDIKMDSFVDEDEFIANNINFRILALDGVTNPQNIGMIIRSACAGAIDAIILSSKGGSSITPLAIKASVGTIFKMPIIQTASLHKTLQKFKANNSKIFTLSLNTTKSYKDINLDGKNIFILGNETNGVSKEIENLSDESIIIPMNRGVESLNVAVTASLLAFM